MNRVQFNMRLDPDVIKKLKRLSKETKLSVARLVEFWVKFAFSNNEEDNKMMDWIYGKAFDLENKNREKKTP